MKPILQVELESKLSHSYHKDFREFIVPLIHERDDYLFGADYSYTAYREEWDFQFPWTTTSWDAREVGVVVLTNQRFFKTTFHPDGRIIRVKKYNNVFFHDLGYFNPHSPLSKKE